MNCLEARQLCAAYLDGELTAAEAAALDAHLAECADCAAELELERDISAALRESAVPLAAPEGLARSVTAVLEAQRRGRPSRLAALTARWRHGLATAAAVLLVATASLGYGVQQWLARTPVVAVNPSDNGGQVTPLGQEPGTPTKPQSGDRVTVVPGGTPDAGSTDTEPGKALDGGGLDEAEATENAAERETGRVTIAAVPDLEPKVFLNKPRTISTTFVKLNVPELDQARNKAVAAAKSHGASYQVQDAQAGTPSETLRFDVDPVRADAFVTRLGELGLVTHRQSDQWEITGQFAAALEEYQALTARRTGVEDPDQAAALDKEIAALERRLTEWNQDAERHIVVLMLQEN